MIITKIEAQKRKERVNIYLDGDFSFGLDNQLKIKYNLHQGMKVDKSFIEQVLKDEELNKVIHSALNFLSYRQRSEKEIYDKLKQKGFNESDIETAIEYCKSKNYINDREFAISFINDKVNLNKFGSQRIKFELIRKGISQNIIDEVLDLQWEDEYDTALDLGRNKMYSYRDDDKLARYRKLGGFLQRKGYSYDIVNKVLKELIK